MITLKTYAKLKEQAVLTNFSINVRHKLEKHKAAREDRTEKEQGGLHVAREADKQRDDAVDHLLYIFTML